MHCVGIVRRKERLYTPASPQGGLSSLLYSASKHTVAVSPDLPVSSASLHVSAILLTNVCTSLVKISAFLCWPWLVHSETDSLTRSGNFIDV